jgi:hypothetical protein
MAYLNGKRILNAKVEIVNDDGGYDEGYTDGYNAGVTVGFSSGQSVGMTQGIVEGEKRERQRFWDKYQTGTSTNHAYRYAGFGWTDETYNPIRPIYTALISHMIFNYSQITDTKVDIEIHSASINVFQGADKLKTIRKLIVSNKTTFSAWFQDCTALENITFEGEICSNIDFHWSEKLTHDSLMSIINHLANTGGTTKTCTLGATNLAKLTNAEKAIATGKGWTLA